METKNIPIGVVTGIAGIYRYIVTIVGEASHAGTTPMSMRDHALVKVAPVFILLPQWVRARNKEMLGTIGQVTVEPGAINVVPGECTFIVELRSMDPKDMSEIRDLLKEWVAEKTDSSVKTIYEKNSVAFLNG